MADFNNEIGHLDFGSPSWANLELIVVFIINQ
jgi:hypothetical protein